MTRIVRTPAEDQRSFRTERLEADLVIVGGGMSGTCCAITAARAGARVVLIQDRPVLGGNASSEVRLWMMGAPTHMATNNRWSREGGVIDEILVENTFRNREGNPVLFDTVVLDTVSVEPNITLLLDTTAIGVDKAGDRITSVQAFCSMNQTMYDVQAPLFCDSSGDGALGFLAGAAFRIGAESTEEFGEGFAPTEEFGSLLGHSIFFYSKDVGHPVTFRAPTYALDFETIPTSPWRKFDAKEQGTRLWWIEYGGRLDTIHDTEKIKWELWRIVYGLWDHVKNSGKFADAENLTLEWVGLIPGRRESRRFEGHYMLRQQDIVDQVIHDDGVAYGGWHIDLHPADGIFSEHEAAVFLTSRGIYQIPYRCLISENVPNLFLAGRLISASHVAFGSTRNILTGSHMGQAVGTAAAICTREDLEPADLLAPDRMHELREELLKAGQHIPGVRLEDPHDLARQAEPSASSEYILDELPAGGPVVPLDKSRAQLLPLPAGALPQVTFTVDVDAPTTLRVEVRTGGRPDDYTPDVILGVREVELAPGPSQRVKIDIDGTVDEPRYVFFCLMANDHVRVHTSNRRVTGLVSVFHRDTQELDEAIGRPRVEFWCPERRPAGHNLAVAIQPAPRPYTADNISNGYPRPTAHPNAWVADPGDPTPTLHLRWSEPQRIRRLDLSFDTDFDHAMESVLWSHPEDAMPFCVKHYRIRNGETVVAEVTDNHQTRNVHTFEPPLHTTELAIEVLASHGDVPAAIFEARCHD